MNSSINSSVPQAKWHDIYPIVIGIVIAQVVCFGCAATWYLSSGGPDGTSLITIWQMQYRMNSLSEQVKTMLPAGTSHLFHETTSPIDVEGTESCIYENRVLDFETQQNYTTILSQLRPAFSELGWQATSGNSSAEVAFSTGNDTSLMVIIRQNYLEEPSFQTGYSVIIDFATCRGG